MCGFCGVVELGRSRHRVDEDVLRRMRDTLTHRGPDDAGLHISSDGRVGLAHRRLSIIDLSANGHQPMRDPDADVWIVYNGEIYNHEELRADLIRRGRRYRSRTDTETILYLYQEHGPAFLQMLEGMFALAIWDGPRGELFVARDRLGIKPLYYSSTGDRFAFGSEIKALLAHPEIPRTLDERTLYYFTSFICAPAPRTLFEGIEKLEPATYMVVGRDGVKETRRYWAPYAAGGEIRDEGVYVEEIRRLLRQATEKRMMSDVPFGAFLSGGIDSSLNVAYMTELLDRPVDTFTVGFTTAGTDRFNEYDYAATVAKRFGTNHREVRVDTATVLQELDRLVWHMDDPVAHPVCVPFYMLSKLAREHGVTVIQVGEGSDEVFLGYERFWNAIQGYHRRWSRYYTHLPGFAKTLRYGLERGLTRYVHGKSLRYAHGKEEIWRRLTHGEEPFWGGLLCFSEDRKQALFSRAFRDRNQDLDTFQDVLAPCYRRIAEEFPTADFGQRMTLVEMHLRLPDHLLMRVDKMSMAFSVESRVPFLDHRLVELAFGIPEATKVRTGAKHILKRAAQGVIPDEIIFRRKQGFAAPVAPWIREAPAQFTELILESELMRSDIFDRRYVERLLRDVVERGVGDLHAWSLLILSRWYEQWFAAA